MNKKTHDDYWRIDCAIRRSWLKYGVILMVMLLVITVCLIQNLSLMGWLVLGLLMTLMVIWQIHQSHISHLTEPPKYSMATDTWLIRWHAGRNAKPQLWQGHLLDSRVYPMMIQLDFDMVEPLPKTITVNIWQDQVDKNQWRRINVLARL